MNNKLFISIFIMIFIFGHVALVDAKLHIKGDNLLQFEVQYEGYQKNKEKYNLDIPELIPLYVKHSKRVKGIYINSRVAKSELKMDKLIKLINESNLNAVVIDIKSITGNTIFSKSNETKDKLKKLITKCHRNSIYVIGRLAVFKDIKLAQQSKYSLKYTLVTDKEVTINSNQWSNPYSKEVWDHNLNIAQKAANLGVDEIQFDYIRFPVLAENSKFVIKSSLKESKADTIVNFLKYAQDKLTDESVLLSADVFGLTTTVDGDLGIGQDITRMVNYVDYISPMIYPSHYNKGMYGLEDPSSRPYQLISRSLEDAKEKLGKNSYKLRPWLQDFSLQYTYKAREIKAQIKAVEKQEINGWLLWNPASNYTVEALINRRRRIR
ncbi:hypothetical protein Halha_0146 [Halobacteroides halobius DSM 5150]|uniref:DUF4015 domain-containing protein n=1 Tax=Halobacteroides halobius (strain ATCC 35273 / DSM 5150 / MD-1) TaxID=748449 RepID=L0K7Q9_HALHC|nr:putative glycoside hydrolase [Halobacteroides halobius]AGB40163.1 hypothetical protein Halha_0146 [Halobacteroides halobius DSM 5150]